MSWRAQGMRTWILQRLTALYLFAYLVAFGIYLASRPIADYADWHSRFTEPLANIATLLFFYALILHAWIGVRDILIDYVHHSSLRLVLWALISLVLVIMAIWVSMLLFSMVNL
jgi:succinate dehydrogenase / fumarate reductase membrane anchor subunit